MAKRFGKMEVAEREFQIPNNKYGKVDITEQVVNDLRALLADIETLTSQGFRVMRSRNQRLIIRMFQQPEILPHHHRILFAPISIIPGLTPSMEETLASYRNVRKIIDLIQLNPYDLSSTPGVTNYYYNLIAGWIEANGLSLDMILEFPQRKPVVK